MGLCSKPRGVIFPGLSQLRIDDHLAIALLRVLRVEVLVFLFRSVELGKPGDDRDNRLVPMRLIPLNGGTEGLFLRRVCVEHRGTILRADVVPLPVQRGRIVGDKKHIEDYVPANDALVKSHRNHLGVACRSVTDVVIIGVAYMATGIAGDHLRDTTGLLIQSVQTPETTSTEHKCLHTCINVREYKMIPRR